MASILVSDTQLQSDIKRPVLLLPALDEPPSSEPDLLDVVIEPPPQSASVKTSNVVHYVEDHTVRSSAPAPESSSPLLIRPSPLSSSIFTSALLNVPTNGWTNYHGRLKSPLSELDRTAASPFAALPSAYPRERRGTLDASVTLFSALPMPSLSTRTSFQRQDAASATSRSPSPRTAQVPASDAASSSSSRRPPSGSSGPHRPPRAARRKRPRRTPYNADPLLDHSPGRRRQSSPARPRSVKSTRATRP